MWLAYAAGLRRGRGEGVVMMRLFLSAAIGRGVLDVDLIEKIGADASESGKGKF